MNCKNLKIRSKNYKKYLYCSVLKKEILFNECTYCENRVYKNIKPIKKRTYSLSKAEKNRYSIIVSNLDNCVICGKKRANLHEVFYGTGKRQLSIEYGLVIPLCYQCHLKIHRNHTLDLIWKVRGQLVFEEKYPNLEFIEVFGRSYK